jgi:putative ABC transport system ATP-binding protein
MLGKPTLSLSIGLVSALILGIIGLLAGYFPARRAASITLRRHSATNEVNMLLENFFNSRSNNQKQKNGEVISLKGLSKVYDTGKVKIEALKGVNLMVHEGEMVAITGPSGSGKSTLMNLIGCLDTATSGSYLLRGEEVSGMSREELASIRNRRVGFIFQSFNLLHHISAYENVEMPLIFGGIPKKERKKRVMELLDRVGLSERMDHKPTELSGGQMQRVAIARALAMDPDIILADEPTGNLDTGAGSDIMNLFIQLWEQGRTILVITQTRPWQKGLRVRWR